VSAYILKRLKLDAIWWLVTQQNPFKSPHAHGIHYRLEACHLLCFGTPYIIPVALDSILGTSRTYDTVAYLKHRLPYVQFVWIMGTDVLAEAHLWHRWDDLSSLIPLAIKTRSGSLLNIMSCPALQKLGACRVAEQDAPSLLSYGPPAWTLLHGPTSSQTSTALRRNAIKS
jgi:nicotinate-nucleotide adenylyltransferase